MDWGKDRCDLENRQLFETFSLAFPSNPIICLTELLTYQVLA